MFCYIVVSDNEYICCFFIQQCESSRTKREKKDGKDYLFYHNSIGLYQIKGAGKKLNECVIRADGLLYQAKENGRDTYVIE